MRASPSRSASGFASFLPPRSPAIVGISFCAGLLLFLVVWLAGRDGRLDAAPPSAARTDAMAPQALPAPLPAGESASGMDDAPQPRNDDPPAELVETLPPLDAPLPDAIETLPAAAEPVQGTLAPGALAVPIDGQTPAPRYPVAAMRAGESGTVMVRVEVGADGVPVGIGIEQSSHSRELDRAAMEAVRQWRFNPAQQDGQPVPSTLVIPIDFNLN